MTPSEVYKAALTLDPGASITAKFKDEQERETFKVALYRARVKEGNSQDLVIKKGYNQKEQVYWVSIKKPLVPTEFILTTPLGEERRLTE